MPQCDKKQSRDERVATAYFHTPLTAVRCSPAGKACTWPTGRQLVPGGIPPQRWFTTSFTFTICKCLYNHLVFKVHTTTNCALRLPETGCSSLLEGASWLTPGGRRDYFGLCPKVRVYSALSLCFLQHGGSFR